MNLIKGNMDYFFKSSWFGKHPTDDFYYKNKLFDAVSSFDLSKVRFKDEHFLQLLDEARKKHVRILGDIHHKGVENHFKVLQELSLRSDSILSDKYLMKAYDDFLIAQPYDYSDPVIVVGGLFQEYPLTKSRDPTSICMVTIGSQKPSRNLEEHLSRATNPEEIVIGFHWGTVPHNDWWLKYDVPDNREQILLGLYAQQEDLILASVADSAFHMVQGNNCTKSLAEKSPANVHHIWTSNAKNRIRNIGVAGVYIEEQMIDQEQLIPSLRFVLNNGLYINKERYLGPIEWFRNTGVPQGVNELFGKK